MLIHKIATKKKQVISFRIPIIKNHWSLVFFYCFGAMQFYSERILCWVSEFDPHLYWPSNEFWTYSPQTNGVQQWWTRKFKTNKMNFTGVIFFWGILTVCFIPVFCSRFPCHFHVHLFSLPEFIIFHIPKRSPNFRFTEYKIPGEWATPGVSCWNKRKGFPKLNPLEIWNSNDLC